MKELIHTFCVAFSLFSRLPVPEVPWQKRPYLLLAFPWVGLVCGILLLVLHQIALAFSLSPLSQGMLFLVFPLIYTGGIHMDGYCDTIDGISSYQSRERKLEILSDPHIGAFAVIGLLCYCGLSFALFYELDKSTLYYPCILSIYPLARCCSAFALVTLPSAKSHGLGHSFHQESHPPSIQRGLLVYIAFLLLLIAQISPILTMMILLCILLVVWRWHQKIYRAFGGITGDLCGYLSQKLEFYLFFTLILYQKGVIL